MRISVDAKTVSWRPNVEEKVMKMSVREAGETKIVEVEGGVDLRTSPDLRRTLFETLIEAPKMAVNLAAVRYIDSSGIATLLEVLKDSQRRNKQFVLFGLTPVVQQVFRLTHVNGIFQAFPTEEEAVAST
jgi:anti-sigma B factor antagonist